MSILLSTFAFTGCGNDIKVSFVSDTGTITRKIKQGETLDPSKIPATPQMQGKYCLWDEVDFASLTEDVTVNYTCYDTVSNLTSNIGENTLINVKVSSEEADLDYILKDLQMTAVLEGGEVKKLYKGDYIVNKNNYNKDVAGNYRVGLAYNNKEIFLNIRVSKISDYVTAVLGSDRGYLNEGLPTITANTTVPGTIKFDDNQKLQIGTVAYNWTFTPLDTSKYEIVKGKSEVLITNASSIVTNKADEVMTFEFGTSKADIISAIQDGLVVTGTFGNVYREIDPQYYLIDSEYKVGQAGDNILFTVSYDANLVANVYVNVKKNENYTLDVEEIDGFEITSQSTLDDILRIIDNYYESSTPGVFTFDEGEVLKAGNYTYSFTFKPDNEYYASKRGEIVINTRKITGIEIDEDFLPRYDYNSKTSTEIEAAIKDSITGKFIYNDGEVIDLDNTLVEVAVSAQESTLNPGTYTYTVSFDDVEQTGEFIINKRKLVIDVDFEIEPVGGTFDPEHPDIIPQFRVIKKEGVDFDSDLFTVKPDVNTPPVPGQAGCLYTVIVVPDESIADEFEVSDPVMVFVTIM